MIYWLTVDLHILFYLRILVIILLAIFFRKRHSAEEIPVKTWLVFMGTEIFSHIFLDVFNAYGIGWFEPFSHYRVSFNVIFVADPFFSIWPAIAAICLLVLKHNNNQRRRICEIRIDFLLSLFVVLYF